MSFVRTSLVDGIYNVKVYNPDGTDTTDQYNLRSIVYKAASPSTFEYLFETEEAQFKVHPDSFQDVDFLYVTVYLDDYLYKSYIRTPIKTTQRVATYNIVYKSHTPLVPTTSPFLERCSYFMPKWSTAFQNDVTVYSKIVYPLFSNLEKTYFKTSEAVSNALYGKPFFKKEVAILQPLGKVTGSDGYEKRYVYNIQNSPITRVSLNDALVTPNTFIIENPATLEEPLTLKTIASRLYISSPLNSTVTIEGVSEQHALISETFTFNTLVVKATKYKYLRILNISSTSDDTIVTNILDCSEKHLYERFEQLPLYVDSDKNLQFPTIRLNGKYLYTSYVRDDLFITDGVPFNLGRDDIQSLYVTDELDIVATTKTGGLLTGQLKRNLETNMPLLESNNNNSFVSVEQIDYEAGLVTFVVDTKKVYEELDTVAVLLEFESDEGVYYLDGNTQELTQERTNFILDRVNHLKIEMNLENYDYISLKLKTEKGDFQASVRNDKIAFTEHPTNKLLKGLYVFGNDLHALDEQGFYNRLTLYKDYYEMYDGVLVSYDKDIKIYSMKGDSIRV